MSSPRLPVVFLLLLRLVVAAPLDQATRRMARDIFQQLIEIDTTDSAGSTTKAAQTMAKRLLECLRFFELPHDAFDSGPGQIRLCDSA